MMKLLKFWLGQQLLNFNFNMGRKQNKNQINPPKTTFPLPRHFL